MSDVENTDVAVDETAEAVIEPEATANVQEEQKVETPKEDPQDRNWKETRAQLKEQQKLIRELKDQLQPRQQEAQGDPYAELAHLAQDDVLTVAQATKLAERQAKRIVEDAMKKRNVSEVEERMRLKYSDFDQVLSPENIEYLTTNEPALVSAIQSNTDPFQQAEAAYRIAKKFCPKESVEALENVKKIEENRKKPLSSAAVNKTSSALDQAHSYANDRILTDEGKKYYRDQMLAARKQPR